ncbi:MAG TPA: hypothetical protein DCY59_11255 [Micrococcaceae bacterium]|nr:hypothetical protein [Micrococcaceae bacterium]
MDYTWLFYGALFLLIGAVFAYVGKTWPRPNAKVENPKSKGWSFPEICDLLGVGINVVGAILVAVGAGMSIPIGTFPLHWLALIIVCVASIVLLLIALRRKLKAAKV